MTVSTDIRLTGTTTQPPAATPAPTPTPPAGNSNETPATVTAVNPVSATVSGGSSVRIRSNASTTSTIVEKVSNGLALTVTGTANGSDGNVWYKVSCNSNGSEIEGFIRSDFVTLSGELTPFTEPTEPENPTEPTEPAEPTEPEPPQVNKDYDTELIDGKWYLIDRLKGEQHDIQGLFDKVTNNYNAYQEAEKTAKMEKVIIIILVFLVVAASAMIALLIFKIKDMTDDAYFNEVESETIRRRSAPRSQGGSQKVMHTVGSGRTGEERAAGQRSGGARPAGGQGGQRPGGARPAGAASGGGQGSQRPGGARPAGAVPGGGQGGQRSGGARPAGAVSGGSQGGQRPGGVRPVEGGQRPMGVRPAGTRPVESGQRPGGARPAEAGQGSGQHPVNPRLAVKTFLAGANSPDWLRVQTLLTAFGTKDLKRLLSPDFMHDRLENGNFLQEQNIFRPTLAQYEQWQPKTAMSPLARAFHVYVRQFMLDDILVKIDRCSMLHSLEVRAPFLDRHVAEFAAALPVNFKLHGFKRKYLLKKAFAGLLPPQILHRNKRGFQIPVAGWLRGRLKPLMEDMLSEGKLKMQGIFNPAFVRNLMDEHISGEADHRKQLWTLLVLELWLEASGSSY